MKILNTLILCLLASNLFSQEISEKKISSEIAEVKVFLDGAQIIRRSNPEFTPGKTLIKFTNLSPFIDSKSIQVKAEGGITVLSVNHQLNYLDKTKKPQEHIRLETKLETLEDMIKIENTRKSIIQEELGFLRENRNIGGKNEQISIVSLQQASKFYGEKLSSLKMEELEIEKKTRILNHQKTDLLNQLNALSHKKEYPSGEILVSVEANKTAVFPIELSYKVENARWFPSYDIRAKDINEPVQLVYKANVQQNTRVNWENIKLSFSSANPTISGMAPELQPYFLSFNSQPTDYRTRINNVSGRVIDANGEALPGVNVVIEGTTIGTVTDLNGHYSITVPDNSVWLTYSFIGYSTQVLQVTKQEMNVVLKEDVAELEEVVITGFGSKKAALSRIRGEYAGAIEDDAVDEFGEVREFPVPVRQINNQTSVDFEIDLPYSIQSDNKNYSVDIVNYELPTSYQYYCVPKIDQAAYLKASIIEWEKYNLLEGEANIFFKDTYIGKSLLGLQNTSDTLEISLGQDKNLGVSRIKTKDFTEKQLMGNKKMVTRHWNISVKNNKNQAIAMILLDQIPVSTREEIEVIAENISGGKLNHRTGIVKWVFRLNPGEKKEFSLEYSVKYPKYKNLIIE